MSNAWFYWWCGLCAVTVFNVAAWTYSAALLGRRRPSVPAGVGATRWRLVWLSGGYVLGCGFRSILPMVDVPRMCLHDTWISRIVVGRSVATVAELCFAAQWALLLHEGAAATGRPLTRLAAYALVSLILVAEAFSWSAVLTSNYLLHGVENSLWAFGAALGVAGFVNLRRRVDRASRRFIDAAIAGGALYLLFMVFVDVPMYLSRWQADLAAGCGDLPVPEGWRQILARCTVVRDWDAWREDAVWLSLYFSVAVWASIALAHAPQLQRHRASAATP